MIHENKNHQEELEIQKQITFAANILRSDVTVQILFESLSEGILIINNKGKIIVANDRIESIFGFTKEELLGKSLETLLPQKTREKHEKNIFTFFKSPRIRPMGIGYDVTAIAKSQKKIPVEISLSYLNTSAGKFGMAFISDISKRKEVENELLEKNKALDAFAHTVAHDLKASLNGIIGFSNLLIDDESIDVEKQQVLLKYILSSGYKMNEIIDALLFMAKVDNSEVRLETIDMDELINSVLNRLSLEIHQKNAHVDIQKNDSIAHALGYGPWVEEVIFNLVGNALKHGGESPRIVIGSEEENNHIRYFIKNSGLILSEEKIEELYQTISQIKIEAASGFGLSIVHRILQKLNGELRIEGTEKEGNIFSFSLPKIESSINT
jgi:PAS domain S-box-containing protein